VLSACVLIFFGQHRKSQAESLCHKEMREIFHLSESVQDDNERAMATF
jgi:hypothetical protein